MRETVKSTIHTYRIVQETWLLHIGSGLVVLFLSFLILALAVKALMTYLLPTSPPCRGNVVNLYPTETSWRCKVID